MGNVADGTTDLKGLLEVWVLKDARGRYFGTDGWLPGERLDSFRVYSYWTRGIALGVAARLKNSWEGAGGAFDTARAVRWVILEDDPRSDVTTA